MGVVNYTSEDSSVASTVVVEWAGLVDGDVGEWFNAFGLTLVAAYRVGGDGNAALNYDASIAGDTEVVALSLNSAQLSTRVFGGRFRPTKIGGTIASRYVALFTRN